MTADEFIAAWELAFPRYVNAGIASSGPGKPNKLLVEQLGQKIADLVAAGGGGDGTLAYATVADMNADLDHDANTQAAVYADSGGDTTDHNGIWTKVGASGTGSWTWLRSLSIVELGIRLDALEAIDADNRLTALEDTTDANAPFILAYRREMIERPGDAPELFADAYTGTTDASTKTSLSPATVTNGKVIQLSGARILARRGWVRIEPNRKYLVRAIAQRATDPVDPLGDAVELGMAWFTNAGAAVSGTPTSVLGTFSALTVASGRTQKQAIVGLASGDDITNVAPAGTVYGRAYVESYGLDGLTNIEVLEVKDVTDAIGDAIASSLVDDAIAAAATVQTVETEVQGLRDDAVNAAASAGADLWSRPVDSIESSEPGSPSIGDRILLDETDATHPNQVAEYFSDGWHYSGAPKAGQRIDLSLGAYHLFNGTSFEPITKVYPEEFLAKGDGSTDDSSAIQDAIDYLAANGGGEIHLGAKSYGLSSTITVAANVNLVGYRGVSILKNLSDSISAVNLAGNNLVSGVKIQGYGSKSSTYLDAGFVCAGDDIKFKDVQFDSVSGPCIYGSDVSDIEVYGAIITDARGGTECKIVTGTIQFGSLGDFHFTSTGTPYKNIKIRDVNAKAATTTGGVVAKDFTVFIDSGSTNQIPDLAFTDIIIEDVISDGYERTGIGVSAEYGDVSSPSVAKITIRDCSVSNTKCIGIKVKASCFVNITGNQVENWETIGPETTVIGGGIHVNNGGGYDISHNMCHNDPSTNTTSTAAINVIGYTPDTYDDPITSSMFDISHNKAYGTNVAPFRVTDQSRLVTMNANQALNCCGHTQVANGTTSDIDDSPNGVIVSNCVYRGFTQGATSNKGAFAFTNAANVTLANCQSFDSGGYGASFSGCTNVIVNGNQIWNSGAQGTLKSGIFISGCAAVTIVNNKGGGYNGVSTMDYGINFSGTITGKIVVVGNDIKGFNTSPVTGWANLPATGIVINDNIGIWSGNASWTPGAISAGSSASKTFTGGVYAGIVAGDFVQTAVPGAGNGCVLEAVTSADTITLTYRNPSAGSLTPSSGTYGVTGKRAA